MKRLAFTLIFALGILAPATAQSSLVRSLEPFNKIKLDGHARIYFIKSDEPSIRIESKKNIYLDNYVTEVYNGVLYLHFERQHEREQSRRVDIYLRYTELTGIDVDGLVRMECHQALSGRELDIKGDGFIKGNIEVDVGDLYIDLDGFSGLRVSGKADTVDLKLDGFGKINARDLETDRVHKDSDGFAWIKTE